MIRIRYYQSKYDLEDFINRIGWDNIKQVFYATSLTGAEFVVIFKEGEK